MSNFFRNLFKSRRQRIMEEEREWRRRIVLATRKMQLVQTTLHADIEDVRLFSGRFADAEPRMRALQAGLVDSRTAFAAVEARLGEHEELMRVNVERARSLQEELEADRAAQREIGRLERELEGLRARLASAGAEVVAEAGASDVEVEELRQRLAAAEAELSRERRRFEEELNELQHANSSRIGELEELAVKLRKERAVLDAVHEREMTKLVEESRTRMANVADVALRERDDQIAVSVRGAQQRIAELEAEVQGLREARKKLLEESAREKHALEQEVAALEERCREFEATSENMKREHAREVDQITEMANTRIQELVALIGDVGAIRLKLQEAHLNEVAAVKKEAEAREAELEERCRVAEELGSELERRHTDELTRVTGVHDEEARALRAEAGEWKRRHAELEERYGREIGELDEKAEGQLAELKVYAEGLQATCVELERSHASAVKELKRAHKKEALELQGQVEALEAARVDLEAEIERLESAIADLEARHAEHVGELTKQGQTEVEEHDARVRGLRLRLSEIQVQHDRQLTELADASQARIHELEALAGEHARARAEADARAGELQGAVDSMAAALAAKDEELAGYETVQAELERRLRRAEARGEQFEGASRELMRLQSEIQSSSTDLEHKATRLLELMSLIDDEERAGRSAAEPSPLVQDDAHLEG